MVLVHKWHELHRLIPVELALTTKDKKNAKEDLWIYDG